MAASSVEVAEGTEPKQRYVFYMHGAWIEQHGLNQPHPKHGAYRYEEILRALEDRAYQVISEVREGEVHPLEYAQRVAGQVRDLLETGVSPGDIVVMGHSKGGQMALMVASVLQAPPLNYVVLAGCGKPGTMFRRSYARFLQQRAQSLQGRILSIYDSADHEAGSCREAFSPRAGLTTNEIVLHTGQGHGLFYAPGPVWLDKVLEWMR